MKIVHVIKEEYGQFAQHCSNEYRLVKYNILHTVIKRASFCYVKGKDKNWYSIFSMKKQNTKRLGLKEKTSLDSVFNKEVWVLGNGKGGRDTIFHSEKVSISRVN